MAVCATAASDRSLREEKLGELTKAATGYVAENAQNFFAGRGYGIDI